MADRTIRFVKEPTGLERLQREIALRKQDLRLLDKPASHQNRQQRRTGKIMSRER